MATNGQRLSMPPTSCVKSMARVAGAVCFALLFAMFFMSRSIPQLTSSSTLETELKINGLGHVPGIHLAVPASDSILHSQSNSTPSAQSLSTDIIEVSNVTMTTTTVTTTTVQSTLITTTISTTNTTKKLYTMTYTNPQLLELYNFFYGYSGATSTKYFQSSDKLRNCSKIPPNLVGRIRVTQEHFPFSQLNLLDFHLTQGGSYSPSECAAIHSVAIIIPFRNREEHLASLLLNLHPFLQKQQLEYTIFVVNQMKGSKFNRALLMNVGAVEALKGRKYDCLIFHDVDLIPENDRNIYTCPERNVRHMSVAIDRMNYQLPYQNILGGIVAIRWDLFVEVNGYSNRYFGWGGEDDDFSLRCRHHGINITRYPNEIARYQMIKHGRDSGNEVNPDRFKLLKKVTSRETQDGLNSLTYKLDSIVREPLFTQVNVVVDQTAVMNAEPSSSPVFPFQTEGATS